jgi:cyanophycin synthetase
VIENSIDTILAEGLGYDRCQVGIVTNLEPSCHFGAYYIETEEHVCNVLRTQIDVVLPEGVAVLNGTDQLVADLAQYSDGEVIYFASHRPLSVVEEHLKKDGRAVLVNNGDILLCHGKKETKLLSAGSFDSSQIEIVLAAIAASWALDISPDLVRAGIATVELAGIV